MSRGPGRVQRGVLVAVYSDDGDRWWSLTELAAAVRGTPLSRVSVESVRRAVKALAERGEVEVDHFEELTTVQSARVTWGDRYAYRGRHYANRVLMFVHTPLSVEAKTARAQFYADSLDRLAALDARIDS